MAYYSARQKTLDKYGRLVENVGRNGGKYYYRKTDAVTEKEAKTMIANLSAKPYLYEHLKEMARECEKSAALVKIYEISQGIILR